MTNPHAKLLADWDSNFKKRHPDLPPPMLAVFSHSLSRLVLPENFPEVGYGNACTMEITLPDYGIVARIDYYESLSGCVVKLTIGEEGQTRYVKLANGEFPWEEAQMRFEDFEPGFALF